MTKYCFTQLTAVYILEFFELSRVENSLRPSCVHLLPIFPAIVHISFFVFNCHI